MCWFVHFRGKKIEWTVWWSWELAWISTTLPKLCPSVFKLALEAQWKSCKTIQLGRPSKKSEFWEESNYKTNKLKLQTEHPQQKPKSVTKFCPGDLCTSAFARGFGSSWTSRDACCVLPMLGHKPYSCKRHINDVMSCGRSSQQDGPRLKMLFKSEMLTIQNILNTCFLDCFALSFGEVAGQILKSVFLFFVKAFGHLQELDLFSFIDPVIVYMVGSILHNIISAYPAHAGGIWSHAYKIVRCCKYMAGRHAWWCKSLVYCDDVFSILPRHVEDRTVTTFKATTRHSSPIPWPEILPLGCCRKFDMK